jgi:hypothetical protein
MEELMRIVWKQGKRGTERCTLKGAWLTARPNGKWSVCVQEFDPMERIRWINTSWSQCVSEVREVRRGRAKPRTLVAAKAAAESKLRALLTKRELRRQRLEREAQREIVDRRW